MLEEITSQLLKAKEKRNHGLFVHRQLPQMRDELARKVYQLQSLEACIDECQAHVDKLQSLSFSAIMASLTGQKASQLTTCIEEIERAKKELDSCAAVVTTLEEQLNQSESELGNMEQLNQTYEQLFDKKKMAITQAGGDHAAKIDSLSNQINELKGNRQIFKSAIQGGEEAIKRLFSLMKTKGRARNKGINTHASGALVATAVNHALQGNPAKSAIRRATEGLEKFHQSILHLGYNSTHSRDAHIMQLISIIAAFSADLSSRGASQIVWDAKQEGPILDAVQETVGLLKEDFKEISKQIETLVVELQSFIENA